MVHVGTVHIAVFSDCNEISSRVKFISYGTDCSATLDRLVSFSVHNAHCYDPNEERKLKSVICAGGQCLFESKIRQLALVSTSGVGNA